MITHPRRHPGVTDGAVDLVTGGAPAEPGQDHDPADDVRHRRPQREDHLQHHERERQLHLFTHTWSTSTLLHTSLSWSDADYQHKEAMINIKIIKMGN